MLSIEEGKLNVVILSAIPEELVLVVDMQNMTVQYQQMGLSRTPNLGNMAVCTDKPIVASLTIRPAFL